MLLLYFLFCYLQKEVNVSTVRNNKQKHRLFKLFRFVPEESITRAILYRTSTDSCPFANEIKSLLKKHLPKTSVKEVLVPDEEFKRCLKALYNFSTWPVLIIEYDVEGEDRKLYVGNESDTKELFEIRSGVNISPKEIA
jgi:glutaredoxin-related protein